MSSGDDRLIRHLERENVRLQRANDELLSKVLFLTGQEYEVAPAELTRLEAERAEQESEHEDPDLPGYTSDPLVVGI